MANRETDLSNYWTANLYFKARNGSFKRVPQIANRGNNGETGGFTVYYTSPGKGKVTAFKPVSHRPDWSNPEAKC